MTSYVNVRFASESRKPKAENRTTTFAPMTDFDVVLFGATGFTGGLTAEYLAAHAPPDTRIALAGRNQAKLEAVRDGLGKDVPLLHADVNDRASIDEVASKARVVITTVGPYIEYGEPLLAA